MKRGEIVYVNFKPNRNFENGEGQEIVGFGHDRGVIDNKMTTVRFQNLSGKMLHSHIMYFIKVWVHKLKNVKIIEIWEVI